MTGCWRGCVLITKYCLMNLEYGRMSWHLCSSTRPLRRQLVHPTTLKQPYSRSLRPFSSSGSKPSLASSPSSKSPHLAFGSIQKQRSDSLRVVTRVRPLWYTMVHFFSLYNYIVAASVQLKSHENGVLEELPSILGILRTRNHCKHLSPGSPDFYYPNHPRNRPI